MVSVIIPVYNVEQYLEQCLISVVSQTYKDIEIILLDDGSTDRSYDLCKKWRDFDDRIRLIHKANEGLGPTRNLGIQLACGEYILFVDSDDWLEIDAIEVLYRNAEKFDSDIVYMNFYFSELLPNKEIKETPFIRHYVIDGSSSVEENKEILLDTDARMWSKLFRKSLFLDNQIEMPAHPYEDFPVMPLLAIYAKRVSQVQSFLYHYNYKRGNNIIGNFENRKYISVGLTELIESCKKRGLYKQYRKFINSYCYEMAKYAVNHISGEFKDLKCWESYTLPFTNFVLEYLPEKKVNIEKKFVVWGSYTLRLCVQSFTFFIQNNVKQFMFSSLVAATQPKKNVIDINGTNIFRAEMIKKEIYNEILKKIPDADYVVVDLLEEVNGLIKIQNDFYTKSEAFDDIYQDENGIIIQIDNLERKKWWREACKKFIRNLTIYFEPNKIILIKNKLNIRYGMHSDNLREFGNRKQIEKVNGILEEMYLYFSESLKGIHIIENDNEEFNYTFEGNKYGNYPYYHNGKYYNTMGSKIYEIVSKSK